MTNPNPTSALGRFCASLSFVGLAGVTSFTGLMLVTPLMIQASHNELDLAVSFLAVTTANLFAVYTLVALFKSTDQQVIAFDRDTTRKLLALLAALGVYLCEVLLWFTVSDFGKLLWNSGNSEMAWFMPPLFWGAVLGLAGLTGRYHQLVWPARSRPKSSPPD